MPTNDYIAFATGPGANVITQPAYLALAQRGSGFQSGIAQSAQLNKVWRQASVVAAMIAQFTADNTNQNVLDDGNIPNLEALFKLAIQAVNRTKLSGNLNIYVSPSGNASNTGLSPSAALPSINQALAVGYHNYDYNGFSLIINLAAGAYQEPVVVYGMPVGCQNVFIVGNTANPQGTVVSAVNGNAVTIDFAQVYLQGFQCGASGVASGLIGNGYGLVATQAYIILDHMAFGSCQTAQIGCYNQSLIAPGGLPLTFSGTSGIGIIVGASSYLWAPNSAITFAGGTVYNSFWLECSSNSLAIVDQQGGGSQFTGSFSGARFLVNYNSSIQTNGAGINYFPGSVAGFADTATFGSYT